MSSCNKDESALPARADHAITQLRNAGVTVSAEFIVASSREWHSRENAQDSVCDAPKSGGRFVAARNMQFHSPHDVAELVAELKDALSGKVRDLDQLLGLWSLAEAHLLEEEARELWPKVLKHLDGGTVRPELSRGNARQGGGQ